MKTLICSKCHNPLALLPDSMPSAMEMITGVHDPANDEWSGQFCMDCMRAYCSKCIATLPNSSPGAYAHCPTCGMLMISAKYAYLKNYDIWADPRD